MYAATAFIIMEAGEIMLPRLGLPDWTVTFIIVLIIIGFPITVIFSWIFDITPEGVKKTESIEVAKEPEPPSAPVKRRLKVSDLIIAVLVVVVVILAYPKIFKRDKNKDIKDPDGRISIAIMPFKNLTSDTLYNVWQEGIQSLLINSLSNSRELAIRQSQTMFDVLESSGHENYASFTPNMGSEIAQKLETNSYIFGSIIKAGNKIRISAQLRDANSQEIYKTYEVGGNTESDILTMADSLSNFLKNYFEIEVLNQDVDYETRNFTKTTSGNAYRNYIQGRNLFWAGDHQSAIHFFNNALEIDSNFIYANIFLGWSYGWLDRHKERKQLFDKLNIQIDRYTYLEKLQVLFPKNWSDKNPLDGIKNLKLQLEYDPKQRVVWYQLGATYQVISQYGKAAEAFEKSLQIDNEWGGRWKWAPLYYDLGNMYHKLGNHDKEKEIYNLGLSILPDHPQIIYRQAICALSQGDTIEANNLIAKFRFISEGEGRSILYIEKWTGQLYQEADQLEKAQEYYQLAIKSEFADINSIWAMNHLAYLLIDNEINIIEGLMLIDRALEADTTDDELLSYIYHTKGLGFYKHGKYNEALGFLNRAWDLRPNYDHDHFLHIQEVEQALASQNK